MPKHHHYYTANKDTAAASVQVWHDHDDVGEHDHDVHFRHVGKKQLIDVSVPVKKPVLNVAR